MSPRGILGGAIEIDWKKFTADSITLVAGTSGNTVADLQSAHDGNIYNLDEASGAPGQDFIIDFVDVPLFDRVKILAYYKGGASHFVTIQLYNWVTSAWDSKNTLSNDGSVHDASFYVINKRNYVGTGINSGKVRVRFLHPTTGIVTHDTFIDEVSLLRVK